MPCAHIPLDLILAEIRETARRDARRRLRRQAAGYVRDGRALLSWTFPSSHDAIAGALRNPDNRAASRRLCHALWRDLGLARALPRHLAGRDSRIRVLRQLLAGECMLLRARKSGQ